MNQKPNRRGHGALIVMVLISMAIILYLMFGTTGGGSSGGSTTKPGSGGGGTSYMGQVSKTRKQGKETAADISTQQLCVLIAQYRNENNKLPKAPADLGDSQSYFKDAWGNEMTFSFEEQKGTGKTAVKFKSKGPDGEANTEDDVTRTDTLPF
jgi:hypothetical protein